MNPQNLGLLLKDSVRRYPKKVALLHKENGRYVSRSWADFGAQVNSVATALAARGLKRGDRLAILSENRPEWAVTDMAAQMLGVITVPVYPSLTSSEIQYILEDSGCSALAVSGKSLFEKFIAVRKSLPSVTLVIGFEGTLLLMAQEAGVPALLLKELQKTPPDAVELEKRLTAVEADDVASLIYTSGTTGFPKGVMLTHANFIRNLTLSRTALRMGETDVHLSFLPLSHVFERMAGHFLMMHIGAAIAYAENMDTVSQNLLEVRPTFVLGVPRFYEKIRDRVLEAVKKGGPFKKGLFFWAKELGEKKRLADAAGRRLGGVFALKRAVASALAYKKFRRRLGGRVRFCVSGGAALPKEIAEFFCDLGILIYEGYGLSETSPVVSVNRENRFKFGTVGLPLEGIEVSIAPDGEILTRGACVMKGYYGKPAETAAAIDPEGWFHTGDLGRIEKDGFLVISGRKKEIIVTSGGKKVSPRPIEEAIEKDPFVLRCVLFGEGMRYITALVVPRKEALLEYAASQKMAFKDYASLITDEQILRFFEARMQELTEKLASYEKIKYFVLLENDFTQAAGELTPTLKVKREAVFSRYRERLLPLYDREKVV